MKEQFINSFIIIGTIGSILFSGQFWVLYYLQYIKQHGWFKPVPGKASFLAQAGVLQCFAIGFIMWLVGAWK